MVEDGGNRVRLQARANKSRPVECGSRSGLPGLDEFLLGVGLLRAPVRVAKDRGEDGNVGSVVKEGAEGNGRGLDGREVVESVAVDVAGIVSLSHHLLLQARWYSRSHFDGCVVVVEV